jgi:RNA recognition motif-containing protein
MPTHYHNPLRVFCANIDYSADESALYNLFSRWCEVRSVKIARHPDGSSRGFAHIELANEADLKTALTLDDYLLIGTRRIRVERVKSK